MYYFTTDKTLAQVGSGFPKVMQLFSQRSETSATLFPAKTPFPRDSCWLFYSFVVADISLTFQTLQVLRSQILTQTMDLIPDLWNLIDYDCLKTSRNKRLRTKPKDCKQSIKLRNEGRETGGSGGKVIFDSFIRGQTSCLSHYYMLWVSWRSKEYQRRNR